jgi:hypothetical protein
MKFLVFLFIGILLPLGANASALTSIKVGDRNYNLVIFGDRDHAEPIKTFNDALKHASRPEVISRCLFAIDMPAGTAHGGHSYGGFCSHIIGKEMSRVMICADTMAGHLEVQPMEKHKYPEDAINLLARFVADNCTGG